MIHRSHWLYTNKVSLHVRTKWLRTFPVIILRSQQKNHVCNSYVRVYAYMCMGGGQWWYRKGYYIKECNVHKI